ncbi:MAG: hypothetical protein JXR78_16735 [Victivallales bacterium]|nr:hypothetical protein [Victivallales bacterium]
MSEFPGNAEPQLGLEKEKNHRFGKWFSRGYLPHRNKTAILQSFTGRWALMHNAELGLGVPGECKIYFIMAKNSFKLIEVDRLPVFCL